MKAHDKGDPMGLLLPYLKAGMTVVDVGAAHGAVTRQLVPVLGPNGRVIAIEPDPRARETFQVPLTVTFLPVACGAINGEGSFYLGSPGTLSSFYPENVVNPETPIRVSVRRLDELVEQADAVKVDVQGAEALVLRGAKSLVRTCPTWVLELWPKGLEAGGFACLDVCQPLWDAGLTVRFADQVEVTPESLAAWLTTSPNHVNVVAHRG